MPQNPIHQERMERIAQMFQYANKQERQSWKKFASLLELKIRSLRLALFYRQATLFLLITLLSTGSLIVTSAQADAYGANPGPGNVCGWHTVLRGDTLGSIARYHHSNISSLARANHISNINRIFVGQRLCIPTPVSGGAGGSGSGLQPNGSIHRFAYNALEWSSPQQVSALLRQAAARHGLP